MLENGFNGFPRASRSIRGRGSIGKRCEDMQSQSFEILASVAGKLLDKSDKCSPTITRTKQPNQDLTTCNKALTNFNSDPKQVYTNNRRIKNEFDIDIDTSTFGDQRISQDDKIEKVYDDNKTCYNREESQKVFPFKKRKFFTLDPLSLPDQGFHRKHAYNSPPENRTNNKFCYAGQQLSSNTGECNVKLSIKSFKVPELFIDISTNATVGSLKRTVMKAVSSILGDGLHVGILVQGKRVRDDNKTLIQTGICQDDTSHNLGFVLEPKHSLTTIPTGFKKEHKTGSHELTRHIGSKQGRRDGEKRECESKSEVGGAVALLHEKSGRQQEYGQRRMRRPFSVTEVEALVRAVEKLGTGRWRDVKLYAFENAKHRTYVDLKDKWKTLVHTARISPQQRRGEPVPQQLLDRVLSAQAFWSHTQLPLISL